MEGSCSAGLVAAGVGAGTGAGGWGVSVGGRAESVPAAFMFSRTFCTALLTIPVMYDGNGLGLGAGAGAGAVEGVGVVVGTETAGIGVEMASGTTAVVAASGACERVVVLTVGSVMALLFLVVAAARKFCKP